MKKTFSYYFICWIILFCAFNCITFIIPDNSGAKYSNSFWIGYAFISLALIGHLLCAYYVLNIQENNKKVFLNMSMFTISFSGVVLSFIVGSLCMIIPGLEYWVSAVICIIIFAIYAILVLAAKTGAGIINEREQQIKEQTIFIKLLTTDASNLVSKAGSPDMKALCEKVYEAVRYSDPMSNTVLSGIENQIMLKFNEFSFSVTNNDENAGKLANELCVLIDDRNTKCKALK